MSKRTDDPDEEGHLPERERINWPQPADDPDEEPSHPQIKRPLPFDQDEDEIGYEGER